MFKLVIFVVLTGSTCSTCSEWGSACLLRYLFHLKFFLNEPCNKRKRKRKRKNREREQEKDKEREREWKRKKKRKRKRKRRGKRERKRKKRERERIRERERTRERERERERTGCFCKRPFFILLAPGSALEKFAAIVKPENKPTKVNWTLSWPSALQICGKTVL